MSVHIGSDPTDILASAISAVEALVLDAELGGGPVPEGLTLAVTVLQAVLEAVQDEFLRLDPMWSTESLWIETLRVES